MPGRITRIFGAHDPKTIEQLEHVARNAEYTALMADGHAGYVMPIGGVAAYRDKVSVPGVGYDIACGNAAIKTDRFITDYEPVQLEQLADEIQRSGRQVTLAERRSPVTRRRVAPTGARG